MVRLKFKLECRLFAFLVVGLNGLGLSAPAQSVYSEAYTFTTFAGISKSGSADGVGTDAQFDYPASVAVDGAGNIYVADADNCTIRKITPAGVVTTLAGLAGYPGNADGTGSAARFGSPLGVAVDGAGNIYVADTDNCTIRKITPAGVVTTLAGSPRIFGSSDGTGTNARFNLPYGVAVDGATNVYVADRYNDTIRLVTPAGVVTTLAGLAGVPGSANGRGTNARLNLPSGVAVDGAGNLYVTDAGDNTIRKLRPVGTNWMVTTLAGVAGNTGSANGAGTNAQFDKPFGLTANSAGYLYVADTGNNMIRQVTPAGVVTTVAGNAVYYGNVDGTGTNADFWGPDGVAVDSTGNFYVADTLDCTIREITTAGVVSTLAGSATTYGDADGTGAQARFWTPDGVATGANSDVYVADTLNCTVRKISSEGSVSTIAGVAGTAGSADGIGSDALFNHPKGVAVDGAGNIYVGDTFNNTVRQVTPSGQVTTLAGLVGNPGSADGMGSAARFDFPWGLAVDSATNVYVVDSSNNTIRRMRLLFGTTNWEVSTIAGLAGFTGSADGTNSSARFNEPSSVAVDGRGNLYVADTENLTIRKITRVVGTTNWVVTTIAGSPGISGSTDGVGTNALFASLGLYNEYGPYGVAVDSATNLYVADTMNDTIRKITPVGPNWVVSTIAGSVGVSSFEDGAGSAALFDLPFGVAVDGAGNVYVADTFNNAIRKGVFSDYTPANAAQITQPANNAELVVNLLPPEANGQWRFPWELSWRNSGVAATNLVQGEYPIEFSTVPGYLILPLVGIGSGGQIVTNLVAVTNGGTTIVRNRYYPTITTVDTNNGGSLTVNIGPSPPNGAGWRFLGNTNAFNPPDSTTDVAAGTYLIEFAPVAGFITPSSLSVQVLAGTPTVLTITYLLATAPPAGVLLPAPVPSGDIGDLADYPFGFNGQLQTDVGYGSGAAVQTNVVLTAAHLIFNDQTLSYVSRAYWFFQQETGVFEPEPLQARGWYVLSGYAAQRTNDVLGGLGADQSSPQSRNLDVAALYFETPVADGGYGGSLPSDTAPNIWLTGTAEKMLAGYPVDGSEFGIANIVNGQMYEVGPQPYPLSQATDPVADQQVYTASWFLSYPGNSGGPFYVEYDGYYYPAGVYLGTLFNGVEPYASAVRAIDSNVVNLITRAATLGDSGTNNSGGGVIIVIPGEGIASNPGLVEVTIAPAAAAQAGGAWKFSNLSDADYSTKNPSALAVANSTPVQLQFAPIPGWNVPTNQSVSVAAGTVVSLTAYYTPAGPQIQSARQSGDSITFTWSAVPNQSYQIQMATNLTQGTWITLAGTLIANGATASISEPISNNAQQFYRVVLAP